MTSESTAISFLLKQFLSMPQKNKNPLILYDDRLFVIYIVDVYGVYNARVGGVCVDCRCES